MTPTPDLEPSLGRMRAAAPPPSLRDAVLGAARAEWARARREDDASGFLVACWRWGLAAAAAVVLDLGVDQVTRLPARPAAPDNLVAAWQEAANGSAALFPPGYVRLLAAARPRPAASSYLSMIQ